LTSFKYPIPKYNEVLVKIHASTVTSGDVRLRALNVPAGFKFILRLTFGFFRPRRPIIGMDFSGEVVDIGKDVSLFNKGDMVFGTAGMKLGANAEYVCLSQKSAIVRKPNNVNHKN